jgi:hypothetical protein
MPLIGEKQSQWLMICKCGAKVKAAGTAVRTALSSRIELFTG